MRENPLITWPNVLYFTGTALFFAILHGFGYYFLYDAGWQISLIDAGVTWLLMAIIAIGLVNLFSYYRPQKGGFFLIFLVPVLPVIALSEVMGMLAYGLMDSEIFQALLNDTQWARVIMSYFILTGITGTGYVWHRMRDWQKKAQQDDEIANLAREAELFKLRQQLQPHFLFNSLNSINSLVGRRPKEARAMVQQLSDFLRNTMSYEDKKLIPVSEEWKRLRQYFDIEQVRFGHRLEVEMEELEHPDFKIPPLILQPILENAIKYGVYGTLEKIRITVSTQLQEPYLHLTICNPYDPDQVGGKGTGFGLPSVKRRLYLLYGRHDLMKLNRDEKEFCVELKIPRAHDKSFSN